MDFNINLIFWLLFCGLNFSFFIPQFLVNVLDTTFLPSSKYVKGFSLKNLLILLYSRTSDDFFRFNLDIIFASIVIILFKERAIDFKYFLLCFCSFFFIYQIYYHAIKKLYVTEPIIYVDFDLIKTGTGILFYGYRKFIILIPILLFVIIFFYSKILSFYLDCIYRSSFGRLDYTLLGLFALAGIGKLLYKNSMIWGYYKRGIISLMFLLSFDIRQSIKTYLNLNKIINQSGDGQESGSIQQIDLREDRPNLYFVFIESYGNVVNTDKELFDKFQKNQKQREEQLENKGWLISTNLSTSCRTGGGSWLVYTSFFYGMKITDIGVFRALTKKNIQKYFKSFFHLLQQAGYKNYFLAPLTGFGKFKINWEEIKSTYAADRIIKNEDLHYSGKHLTSFGQQPPDQYSLNAAHQIMKEDDTPSTLFFLSLNSHAPWHSPVQIEANWKELGDKDFETTVLSKQDLKKNYLTAINYQLDYCTDFVNKELSDNDIFIMIGDHQPPLITTDISDFDTPIHILTKNKDLQKSLGQYGFIVGLSSNSTTSNIRHESLYSLIMRELATHYGIESSTNIPDFLPDGIKV